MGCVPTVRGVLNPTPFLDSSTQPFRGGTMTENPTALAALAIVVLATSAQAQVPPAAPHEIQAAEFLVGTWNCSHQVGSFSGTYTTSFAKVLGDLWLKQTYAFPATADRSGAAQAKYLIGYDRRAQRWA